MSDDLVSKLISQLDEKEGTSVFDPSASVLNRVGDYAERTERESSIEKEWSLWMPKKPQIQGRQNVALGIVGR